MTLSANPALVMAYSAHVIELVPPGVRTKLYGQGNDEHAMPLDEFLDEALTLLYADPAPKEIVVERATFLRNAAASGSYDDMLKMLSNVTL